MNVLITLIQIMVQLLSILIIVDIILSYFMSPYQPIRMAIDRIVQPMLAPIRRVVPPLGMIDFSPMVLLILVQVIGSLLIGIISRMG